MFKYFDKQLPLSNLSVCRCFIHTSCFRIIIRNSGKTQRVIYDLIIQRRRDVLKVQSQQRKVRYVKMQRRFEKMQRQQYGVLGEVFPTN